MTPERSPQDIADALLSAFPEAERRPEAGEIERVMRPLGYISTRTQRAVEAVLRARGNRSLGLWVGSWIEANIVTGPPTDDREHRIRFLLMDTCTCVLEHLEAAIAHAPGDVDPRILELRKHPYFREKR